MAPTLRPIVTSPPLPQNTGRETASVTVGPGFPPGPETPMKHHPSSAITFAEVLKVTSDSKLLPAFQSHEDPTPPWLLSKADYKAILPGFVAHKRLRIHLDEYSNPRFFNVHKGKLMEPALPDSMVLEALRSHLEQGTVTGADGRRLFVNPSVKELKKILASMPHPMPRFKGDMPKNPGHLVPYGQGLLRLDTSELLPRHANYDVPCSGPAFSHNPLVPAPNFRRLLKAAMLHRSSWPDVQEHLGELLPFSPGKTPWAVDGPNELVDFMAQLIPKLVGEDSVVRMTADELANPKCWHKLINRRVALVDARRNLMPRAASDLILACSRGEALNIRLANGRMFHGTVPTKFVFLTNCDGCLPGGSLAFAEKTHILRFKDAPAVCKDKDLLRRVNEEVPEIFGQSLVGFRRTQARGGTIAESDEAREERIGDLGFTSLVLFLSWYAAPDPTGMICCDALHQALYQWLVVENMDDPTRDDYTSKSVAMDLLAVGIAKETRMVDGDMTEVYVGISLAN